MLGKSFFAVVSGLELILVVEGCFGSSSVSTCAMGNVPWPRRPLFPRYVLAVWLSGSLTVLVRFACYLPPLGGLCLNKDDQTLDLETLILSIFSRKLYINLIIRLL